MNDLMMAKGQTKGTATDTSQPVADMPNELTRCRAYVFQNKGTETIMLESGTATDDSLEVGAGKSWTSIGGYTNDTKPSVKTASGTAKYAIQHYV